MSDHDAMLVACAVALARLVALKDGPRDAGYEASKAMAWEQAREAVAGFVAAAEAITTTPEHYFPDR